MFWTFDSGLSVGGTINFLLFVVYRDVYWRIFLYNVQFLSLLECPLPILMKMVETNSRTLFTLFHFSILNSLTHWLTDWGVLEIPRDKTGTKSQLHNVSSNKLKIIFSIVWEPRNLRAPHRHIITKSSPFKMQFRLVHLYYLLLILVVLLGFLFTCSFAFFSYSREANGCLQTNTYHNLIHSRTYLPINIVMKHKAATITAAAACVCLCVCLQPGAFYCTRHSVCAVR